MMLGILSAARSLYTSCSRGYATRDYVRSQFEDLDLYNHKIKKMKKNEISPHPNIGFNPNLHLKSRIPPWPNR